MRRLDNGCESPFLPTHLRENPPEAIRSTRMHRRPTLSGSLCHAVMKILFSVTGFLMYKTIIQDSVVLSRPRIVFRLFFGGRSD